MRLIGRVLIAAILIFATANKGLANCPIVSPDSTISFPIYLGDSLDIPVARASGDSLWIYVWYPSGGLAFVDSARILTDGNITYRQTQMGAKLTAKMSYKRVVNAIDGTAQNGPYSIQISVFDSSLALPTEFEYCFDERLGGLDSIGVDGTQFAAGTGYIDASVIADDAIDAGAIAASAIGASEVATDAIGAAEIAASAIGTSEWAAEADNNGVNWADVSNPTTTLALTGTTIADSVIVDKSSLGDLNIRVASDDTILADIIKYEGSTDVDAEIQSEVEDGVNAATDINAIKAITDQITFSGTTGYIMCNVADWGDGTLTIQSSGGFPSVHTQSVQSGALAVVDFNGGVFKSIADSVWNDWISSNTNDSTFGGAFTIGGAAVRANYDSSYGTLSDAQIDLITTTFLNDSLLGLFTRLNAIRDSMDEAAQTGTATLGASTMGSISDSVWAKDTSNTLWNGLLNRFGEWNASAQAVTGSNCGSGAQALTIYVLDTSGTDELVTAFVTIYNSAQTSILAYGTALSGVTGTFGVSASTAHKGLALAHGYYFPLYSFTTGSGASHTDTIRGYDIPTSAGSAVPSGQQVQLYDWVISPANDTLYGAEVEITLAGASNFYTSTNLVPPARVVVYAGVNDGSANGGKWQDTIFGTDSLFTSGVDNANYTITIKHKLLKFPVVYEGLSIPASATATRLRTILENQD